MGTITVKHLRLKTIIGINPEERIHKQDVLINYQLSYDMTKAQKSDTIQDALDYKRINKDIISFVRQSNYQLLEKLTSEIMAILRQNPEVTYAKVEVEKPGALRFTDSVSVTLEYVKPSNA